MAMCIHLVEIVLNKEEIRLIALLYINIFYLIKLQKQYFIFAHNVKMFSQVEFPI